MALATLILVLLPCCRHMLSSSHRYSSSSSGFGDAPCLSVNSNDGNNDNGNNNQDNVDNANDNNDSHDDDNEEEEVG